MKPTVITNSNASASAGGPANGVNVPINQEYGSAQQQQQPYHPQYADASTGGYSSPSSHARQQQQHPQQQIPAHFQQGFGFEPDMDMDMFPRTRLGRMHDPFAGFGAARKRSNVHEPQTNTTDGFSRYFDDAADFGFPQFGSLGRRRAGNDSMANDHDFFNRLPSEFRQYIPEEFGGRRGASNTMPTQQHAPAAAPTAAHGQYYPGYPQQNGMPPQPQPQTPSKNMCDASMQTEDPAGRSEVDSVGPLPHDNLSQHGLRNTVDLGVKSALENEMHGPRSHSAPPPEQLQQQQQQHHQQVPVNGKRMTPPPHGGQPQFGTQTSPQSGGIGVGQPQFHKAYYAPQQQAHPQQKQQTPPPPQTPGGTYIRTIPIFVEGRSEPIINSHKEIPNQHTAAPTASATASARAFTPQQPQPQQQQQYYQQPTQQQQQHPQQQQQQHRPTPLNTQQQPQQQQSATGAPPQTPHTLDSINKIQDIQRDVLDLMSKVENFSGTRKDKEYAYLDEMLTRNLLKLDTIDTNGKESIRLARKEAIKCIQASINVLEAKAEENARNAQGGQEQPRAGSQTPTNEEGAAKSASQGEITKETNAEESAAAANSESQSVDAAKIQEPIPLPPPKGMQIDEQIGPATESSQKEASPAAEEKSATEDSNTTVESK